MEGFDHINWEIIVFEVGKNVSRGIQSLGSSDSGRLLDKLISPFCLNIFCSLSMTKLATCTENFIAFQLGNMYQKIPIGN